MINCVPLNHPLTSMIWAEYEYWRRISLYHVCSSGTDGLVVVHIYFGYYDWDNLTWLQYFVARVGAMRKFSHSWPMWKGRVENTDLWSREITSMYFKRAFETMHCVTIVIAMDQIKGSKRANLQVPQIIICFWTIERGSESYICGGHKVRVKIRCDVILNMSYDWFIVSCNTCLVRVGENQHANQYINDSTTTTLVWSAIVAGGACKFVTQQKLDSVM